jgi:hypothetical protein
MRRVCFVAADIPSTEDMLGFLGMYLMHNIRLLFCQLACLGYVVYTVHGA